MKEKKYKILLVDDDKFLLDMYATKFGERDFEVIPAFGATEALSKIDDGIEPDIILTDVVMPVMDGFEFLAEIKQKKLVPHAIIVILSNLGQKEEIEKGKEVGAKGYIIKSMSTPTEVVNKVLEIVESK